MKKVSDFLPKFGKHITITNIDGARAPWVPQIRCYFPLLENMTCSKDLSVCGSCNLYVAFDQFLRELHFFPNSTTVSHACVSVTPRRSQCAREALEHR